MEMNRSQGGPDRGVSRIPWGREMLREAGREFRKRKG